MNVHSTEGTPVNVNFDSTEKIFASCSFWGGCACVSAIYLFIIFKLRKSLLLIPGMYLLPFLFGAVSVKFSLPWNFNSHQPSPLHSPVCNTNAFLNFC